MDDKDLIEGVALKLELDCPPGLKGNCRPLNLPKFRTKKSKKFRVIISRISLSYGYILNRNVYVDASIGQYNQKIYSIFSFFKLIAFVISISTLCLYIYILNSSEDHGSQTDIELVNSEKKMVFLFGLVTIL